MVILIKGSIKDIGHDGLMLLIGREIIETYSYAFGDRTRKSFPIASNRLLILPTAFRLSCLPSSRDHSALYCSARIYSGGFGYSDSVLQHRLFLPEDLSIRVHDR